MKKILSFLSLTLFSVAAQSTNITAILSWSPVTTWADGTAMDPQTQVSYSLYRADKTSLTNYTAIGTNLVQTAFTNLVQKNWAVSYRVTAVANGMESLPSTALLFVTQSPINPAIINVTVGR